MLQPTIRRIVPSNKSKCFRCMSTPARRQATVATAQTTSTRTSDVSAAQQDQDQLADLPPQPLIPRPLSRTLQIKSLSRSTTETDSTCIELHSPLSEANGGGASHLLTIPNLFLRDSSTHPQHLHPSSKQKLFRTSDIPSKNELKGYGVHEIDGQDHLVMEWNQGLKGFENKKGDEAATLSVTPLSLLVNLLRKDGPESLKVPQYETWDQKALLQRLQRRSFNEVMNQDRTTLALLEDLLRDGIAFVSGVPHENKVGQNTDLRTLVERLSSVRNTWYGNLFDVKAEVGSKNIAYTNLDLGLHMDLVHFEHPPRYQFLQSLQNTGVKGGSSYFVDSYAVSNAIKRQDPTAFDTLTREPVLFEYRSDAHHTRYVRPTIELEENDSEKIKAVNYSPPFQGPLPLTQITKPGSAETVSQDSSRLSNLRDSLALFADFCDKEEFRYNVQLTPGECVIFDNRRVLHARTAFEFEDQGEGGEERGRWLKGAYCDGDEVKSLWRILADKRRKGTLKD